MEVQVDADADVDVDDDEGEYLCGARTSEDFSGGGAVGPREATHGPTALASVASRDGWHGLDSWHVAEPGDERRFY